MPNLINYDNGTVTVSVTGGTAPYSFLLQQNGTAFNYSGANFINPISSSSGQVTFGDSSDQSGDSGVPAGVYTCQVTDANGCITTTPNLTVSQDIPTTTTAAPTYTVTINAVADPANIVGSHPLVSTGNLAGSSYTIPGPTWSVTGYTFIGYDTYSGTPMAPPQYQPGDSLVVTGNVNLYARYEAVTTTTTTTEPTTTTSTTTTTTEPTTTTTTTEPTTTTSTTTTTTEPTTTTTTTEPTTTTTTSTTTTTTEPTTTTTTSTTSTTTTTTTPPDETTFYHFHMGGSTYPFTDALGTGTAYLIGDTGYTPYPLDNQTNVDLIMTDLIDNSNGAGSTCTPGTFEFAGPIDGTNGCNGSWNHNLTGGDDYYYLAVPNNASFQVNLVTDGLLQESCSGTYNASDRRAFTYNGESYWLYKMINGQGSIAKTFNFK